MSMTAWQAGIRLSSRLARIGAIFGSPLFVSGNKPMRRIGWTMVLLLVAVTGFAQTRKQVGQVKGQAVYSDQIVGKTAQERSEAARDLFMKPIVQGWARQHAAQFKLSPEEAARLADDIRAYAACSGSGYALPENPAMRDKVLQGLGGNVKLQKALYDAFGGGRVLFQQGGVEAFDATRKLLEQKEASGEFSFTDPQVRELAYGYWTGDHGAMMLSEPGQIARALDIRSIVARCPGK